MRIRLAAGWMALLMGSFGAFSAAAQAAKPAPPPSEKEQDIVAAAKKAREAKKGLPQAKRVFTNDDLSAAVTEAAAGTEAGAGASQQAEAEPAPGGAAPVPAAQSQASKEAEWRGKFAELRAKLASAEKELDLIQRERNLNEQQYYSDPNKALREQYTRNELNTQKAKIDAKREEIARLKTQISDLEDELRRAGLPAGWSRPQ